MQLFIKTLSSRTLTLNDIDQNDTIFRVKKQIEEKEKIPVDQIRLMFAGKILDNDIMLSEYKISPDSTLHIILRSRGGGSMFNFSDMESYKKLGFSKDAPKWRVVFSGLNLEGICNNTSCDAFGKKVWMHFGFGKFKVEKLVDIGKCPICHQLASKISSGGFVNCRYSYEGTKVNNQSIKSETKTAPRDNLIYYDSNNGEDIWNSMTIFVEEC